MYISPKKHESFESQTDAEQSTDINEDVVEQSSVVQPYQFEPVVDSSDYEQDKTDEDSILRETLEARFMKTVAVSSW